MSHRPNILLILADDLGYGDLGCYGACPEHVRTPHIDALARDGVRCTDAHSPSSVCTPSRYNLLTGRYCWRTWAKTGCIWANDPCVIEDDRPTIASVLRDGGYETGMVGKWHLGFGSPDDERWDAVRGPDYNRPLSHGPQTCGFDRFFGIPAVGQLPHVFIQDDMVCDLESGDPIRMVPDPRPRFLVPWDRRPRDKNWRLGVEGGTAARYISEDLADRLTEQVVNFIERPHDRPFFCYFAHRNVHGPLDPHPRFRGTSGIGVYGDFIHELDGSVGRVLDALERSGRRDDTIVVFASDNGATEHHRAVERVCHNGHYANGPFRGSKTEVFEGGHRIPLIARWPGHIPAGTQCDHLLALTDLLATCTALAGVALPENAGPDGFSCSASLLDPERHAPARDTLIHDSFFEVVYAVRHGDWKLIMDQHPGGLAARNKITPPTHTPGMLFNLAEDPGETTNRYSEHPDIVNALTDRFLAIRDPIQLVPL
jgi:arylsulfatase A-like enzyme